MMNAEANGMERLIIPLNDGIDRIFEVTRKTIKQVDGPPCELTEKDKWYIFSIYQDCVYAEEMGYSS